MIYIPRVKSFIRYILFILVVWCLFNCDRGSKKEVPPGNGRPPNILFIVVDDLRPELGCYGTDQVISPNIDKIASQGLLFEKAYCNYAVCGPSRSSFLTGLYPTRERFAGNGSKVDEDTPEIITLPQHFKNNGYHTISNGKVFHDHGNVMDGMDSWSEQPWEPHPGYFVWLEEDNRQYSYRGYKYIEEYRSNKGPSWEAANVPDNAYPTGKVTDKTIADIGRLKRMREPFFLAVGYRKPHLPLNAPKKYWDMYDPSQFSLADNFGDRSNLPEAPFHRFSELRAYRDIPNKGPLNEEMWLRLLHGYYACVSYTDAQIGLILDELKEQGLAENTIVVVFGDHGYQLTEHGMWSKHNTMDVSINAPLIISIPGKTSGQKTKGLVEFIDIYPTLAELAGISIPEHTQGKSFVPLIDNPKQEWKDAVFSRCNNAETIVTNRYAYTEWQTNEGQVYENMLFDHINDPNENNNLTQSAEHTQVIELLSKQLNEHIQNR